MKLDARNAGASVRTRVFDDVLKPVVLKVDMLRWGHEGMRGSEKVGFEDETGRMILWSMGLWRHPVWWGKLLPFAVGFDWER